MTHILPELPIDWPEAIGAALTITDAEGRILYQNARARDTYKKEGNLIGRNMIPCHNERSRGIISHMLASGETNTYTVKKGGIRKLIFQSPWRDADGRIAGLMELSIPLPADMPHYDRDTTDASRPILDSPQD